MVGIEGRKSYTLEFFGHNVTTLLEKKRKNLVVVRLEQHLNVTLGTHYGNYFLILLHSCVCVVQKQMDVKTNRVRFTIHLPYKLCSSIANYFLMFLTRG